MEYIVLGLGSNKSFEGRSPLELLALACSKIKSCLPCNVVISSVYKTGAMYVTDQDDFYNMAVLCFYNKEPHDLLKDIHLIENSLGRNRSNEFRNGPRPLDIDIELFGTRVVNDSDLIIPHQKLHERSFVLTPLVEVLQKYADDIKSSRTSKEEEKLLTEDNAKCLLKKYEQMLSEIQNQKIEKYIDSSEFIKMMQ